MSLSLDPGAVVVVAQPAVLHVEGVPAEPTPVGDQHPVPRIGTGQRDAPVGRIGQSARNGQIDAALYIIETFG